MFQDMIENAIRQQTLNKMSRYRCLQSISNTKEPVGVFINLELTSSKDIYGQDKQKLKTAESSRYFECDNCGRKIAGGRFAQHLNKCLERKRK